MTFGMSKLHDACRDAGCVPRHNEGKRLEDELALVTSLLETEDLEQKDDFNRTPLIWACYLPNFYQSYDFTRKIKEEIVLLLIQKGADVNANAEGWTPLGLSVHRNSPASVKELVARGANLESKGEKGQTPLMSACGGETTMGPANTEIARLLVQSGAEVNVCCVNGRTPLMYACESGLYDLVELLIAAGADIHAVSTEREPVTVFGAACRGASVNGYKYEDVEGCRYDIPKKILEAGADVLTRSHGHPPIYTVLNSGGSENAQKELVQALIQKGADLMEPGHEGQTGLEALVFKFPKVAKQVMQEKGLDLNQPTNGTLPLHHAVTVYVPEAIPKFLDLGASITAVDGKGMTALHHAATCFKPDNTELLLDRGADVNACDNQGQTPLIVAIIYGREQQIELLMERGADKNVRDKEGKTAGDYARERAQNDAQQAANLKLIGESGVFEKCVIA
ncbi:hypothetical protein CYMTET_31326 [Cymbomonas tetramitiformis]|uniref:Ankyrin n=1 Tax=Cymbomonas tetramitiformis TaxID=36881 RepID=A0AAE0FH68_9CHLO|nr:hypothetical protein CYMTET_31326 [Cymbomonas tetramitiformis]|eukprot:gene16723-19864_t